jgi:D-arabinose 1-dehydrogenase-like Zn-dependent alcohol dehydrogenase
MYRFCVALDGTRRRPSSVAANQARSVPMWRAMRLLRGERSVVSVANLTRADGAALMQVAATIPLELAIETFAFAQANDKRTTCSRGPATADCAAPRCSR